MTFDEFDHKLKELLSEAARHGFAVRSVDSEYIDVSPDNNMTEYLLTEVNYRIESKPWGYQ